MANQPALFDNPLTPIGATLFIDGVPRGTVLRYNSDFTKAYVERRLDDGLQSIWVDLPAALDGEGSPIPRDFGPDPLIAKIRAHLQAAGYADFVVQFLNSSEANFKVVFRHNLDSGFVTGMIEKVAPLIVKTTLSFKNWVSMSVPAAWRAPDAGVNDGLAAELPMSIVDDTPTQELDPDELAAIAAAAAFSFPGQPSELDAIPMPKPVIDPLGDETWQEFTNQPGYEPPAPSADEQLLHANERIAALEESLRLLLNPQPVRKEVWTLTQDTGDSHTDDDLGRFLNDGWEVLHIAVNTYIDNYSSDYRAKNPLERHIRIVTLVREVPAAPAEPTPKPTQAAASYVMIDPLRVAGLFENRFPLAHEINTHGVDAFLAQQNIEAIQAAERSVNQYRAAFPSPEYTQIPGRRQ